MKWTIVCLLLLAGVVANNYYITIAWAIRTAIGIVLCLFVLWLGFITTSGQKAWSFIKEARKELRKVAWPTRQETIQTTWIVVLMVIVMASLLWAFDSLFLWLVGKLAA